MRSRRSIVLLVVFPFSITLGALELFGRHIGAPNTSRAPFANRHASALLSSSVRPPCTRPVHLLCAAGFDAKSPRISSSADPQHRQFAPRVSRIRDDWPCSAPPGGASWTIVQSWIAQLCGTLDKLLPPDCIVDTCAAGACQHGCKAASVRSDPASARVAVCCHILLYACSPMSVSKNSTGYSIITNTYNDGRKHPVSNC